MGEVIKEAVNKNYPFWVLMISSIILMLISLITPPLGKIDNSVIAGVGELAVLAAIWCVIRAMDKGVGASVRHGSTEVTIEHPEDR